METDLFYLYCIHSLFSVAYCTVVSVQLQCYEEENKMFCSGITVHLQPNLFLNIISVTMFHIISWARRNCNNSSKTSALYRPFLGRVFVTDLLFPFWIDDLLFLSLKLLCLLMYTVCVTVNYLYESFVLSDFAPLCGIDSEPRRSGAPWTGRVEDAIGVKWISDRVFNHGPGKKKKKPSTIPSYRPLTLALHCCLAVHAKHNCIYFIG